MKSPFVLNDHFEADMNMGMRDAMELN